MKAKKLGIIAEDDSDIDVVKSFIPKLTQRPFSISKRIGHGCGAMERKLYGWCLGLRAEGCAGVLVIRDLDRNDRKVLQNRLSEALHAAPGRLKQIVIPVEEIEAWLLADTAAIKAAMRLQRTPKRIFHPETITSPKEYLEKLVRTHSKDGKKLYVNAVDNQLISRHTDIDLVKKCCPSFQPFYQFVQRVL